MNPNLSYRLLNRPIAVEPRFVGALAESIARPQASLVAATDDDIDLPYQLLGQVAVIPVVGTLVHSYAYGPYAGETLYDRIAAGMMAAVADPKAQAIVMHVASPGGEVDGCFELAESIYQMRGEKPVWAICDPYAYSAAYALASAADSIFCPITGGVGSIGVVCMHMEFSKMLEETGIGVTLIQFGDRKTERGPFAPLAAGAQARIQAEVDEIGEMFVDMVARNRGLSTQSVRATQAGTFLGAAAVENKLADAVYAPQAAFSLLERSIR
jgi:signal peptide peptidase SppA